MIKENGQQEIGSLSLGPSGNKIGLFGGTFDPIHIGHTIVAEWIWDALGLERIIFIPNYIHPFHKRQGISDVRYRLRMLQLALADFPQFDISTLEIDREGVSYTIDTIRYFQKKYANTQLFLLIGTDNLNDFWKWKEPENILKEAQLVVYNRKGFSVDPKFKKEKIVFLDTPHIEISSTEIRQRIQNNRACQSLLHPMVYQFIKEHKIYQKS